MQHVLKSAQVEESAPEYTMMRAQLALQEAVVVDVDKVCKQVRRFEYVRCDGVARRRRSGMCCARSWRCKRAVLVPLERGLLSIPAKPRDARFASVPAC